MKFRQLLSLVAVIGILGSLSPVSFALAGTVLSSYKYAWSDNAGYINFENVTVDSDGLSGFAWSTNDGWIKFDPDLSGVSNNGIGNLSGWAWGEQLGWINFGGVYIDQDTGEFSGIATGDLIGTLTFDCPTYCDVRTDWRSIRQTGGGGGRPPEPPPEPTPEPVSYPTIEPTQPVTETPPPPAETQPPTAPQPATETSITLPTAINEESTITPEEAGFYTLDTDQGEVTIVIVEEPVTPGNDFLIIDGTELVNSVFYEIIATDENGDPVESFLSPVTITLPVPTNLATTKNLGVYQLNEPNWQWSLIPDAVFTDGQVTFKTNHLNKYAIFNRTDEQALPPSLILPTEKNPAVIKAGRAFALNLAIALIASSGLFFFLAFKFKRSTKN